ncbi:mRNA-decapping enzyme 1B [Clupea harengus]|uniref:mRNA-decapping enzyme 1B n=1 Tax=Clupea harengus TaxID=7950 RepID=A0A6P8GH27_CLUHA|nr:mRNA-decapping enzyme 1B [Clupea harengus]
MLTKARNEYDKGKPSSEPKEIGGGGGAIHDNPHLIKPIPLKPTDRQRLLQHKAAAPPSFSQSHSGPSPGVGGRPAVARSLSYDDPSAQAVPVSPGGGPLLGAAPPPSSSSSSQPCAAIQKLMSGQRGAPEVQPPTESPDKRLALLSGLQAVHPMVTIAGAFQQHMQQHPHPPPPHHQHRPPQQPPPPPPGQPLFYSPVKPLPPAALHLLQMSPGVLQPGQVNTGVHPPAQVGPGVLPAQVSSGVPPPGQVSAGVVSPHELLQRLQLVQQEQNLNQSQAPEHSRPPLAPCFHQPQNQNQTRPTETSTAGPAGLNSSQHFQSLPAPVGPALLISPSVFSQAPPPRSAPHPEEPRVLSRSQLQATLTHLIQNDSSFLDVIYEAYISRFVKDDGRPHY